MNKSILNFSIVSLFIIGSAAIIGCGGSESETTEDHQHEKGMYSCPMHPEITGEQGDTCSICKMDLELKEHDHGSHSSSGHMEHMRDVRDGLKAELGDKYDQPAPPATAEQLALGSETYIKFCVTCHGETGKGDGALAVSLESQPADFTDNAHSKYYSDQGRIHIIKKGVEGTQMVGWDSTLDVDQIAAVYAYVRSLRSSKETGGHAHSHAGEDHAHGSPHGGVVKTAGNYHIEMATGKGNVSFYLLDGAENTISNTDLTGTAIFQFDDQSSTTEKLALEGSDHLVAQLKDPEKSFTCIVSFKVDGKSVSAKFKKEGENKEGHSHDGHDDGHHH